MKTDKILSNRYLRSSLLIAAGLLLGWIFFHHPNHESKLDKLEIQGDNYATHEIWTCSMHPQIRMDEPGSCPICGMDLIPLKSSDAVIDEQAIEMSESATKLAEVQTSIVHLGNVSKEVRLYGKIQPDERLLKSQTAHVPGRIEQLMVNVTGENVKKGQLIARIYSPELVTAQKELFEAKALANKYPAILDAAKEKLRLWKLTDSQIETLLNSGTVKTLFDVYATVSGTVANRKVNGGDYVSTGDVIYEIADLSRVWAEFDAYETDLPWISVGQNLEFSLQAIPGKTFDGKIIFIDPVVDSATRITKIRVEIANKNMQFKPEMFVNGIVQSKQNVSDNQFVIPQSAVLWTGKRSVVYLKLPNAEQPTFKMREITLGNAMKDSYVVLDGLADGDEIVTNGTFSVDAAAQLAGKTSMMNPEGTKVASGHNHGSGNMEGMDMPEKDDKNITNQTIDRKFKTQLNTVYRQYLSMKNAFVDSDTKKVADAAKKLLSIIQSIDIELLEGDAHVKWMRYSGELEKSLQKIISKNEIEVERQSFINFNNTFYKVVKEYGLSEMTVYYQFCPMANDNKGAYWLSETDEIRNPYFGAAMMSCGETKEIIKW